MAISKVILNGNTLMDITQDTVASSNLLTGYTAHGADGDSISGAYAVPSGTINISQNGIVNVTNYASANVNVSGGGGSPIEEKQVNFIDYDGRILYSYTAAQASALSSLPTNPSHSGLTSQGWNWTLAEIKAQLVAYPSVSIWVGQMYVTTSGKTEIDVSFPSNLRLSPILGIAVNGTVKVDWGDGTSLATISGTSLTTIKDASHTYSSPGDYIISINVTSGSFQFYGGSTATNAYSILRKNSTANENRVYANCIKAIRLGNGTNGIGSYACFNCDSLKYITIPSGVTEFGEGVFRGCRYLTSITLPKNVTDIPVSFCNGGYSFVTVSIPSGITSIGGSAFSACYSLKNITIPSSVTSIGSSAFYSTSLTNVTIPSGVTSIEGSIFYSSFCLEKVVIPNGITSVGSSAFRNCSSLVSLTLPSTLTSIGTYAFNSCYGIKEYHFLSTSVPTGASSMFYGIASDCVIYVPSGSVDDYKTASIWSTWASYIQGE